MSTAEYKTLKIKAARFCAYRERAVQEVREKLRALGASEGQRDQLIQELIQENFLNEQRYARAFTLDKFRFNKWGKVKIRQQLRQKGVEEAEIDASLMSISGEDYVSMVRQLARQKGHTLQTEGDQSVKKQKVIRYLQQKGFEYEIIAQNIEFLS